MADQIASAGGALAAPEVSYSLICTLCGNGESQRTGGAGEEAVRAIEQLDGVIAELRDEGVELRGCYDLTGFEDHQRLLVWLRGSSMTDLQWAQRQLLRTEMCSALEVFDSFAMVELTELEPQPRRWLNLLEASEPDPEELALLDALADDDLDELVDGEPDVADPADFDQADLDAADPELGLEDDATLLRGDAVVSLHSELGIGEMRFFVVAEADEPVALLGDLGQPFGDDVEIGSVASLTLGRLVTPAEIYEVLH